MTLLLNNDDVARLLPMQECMEAMEEAFRGLALSEAVNRGRTNIITPLGPGKSYVFVTMEGVLRQLGIQALRIRSDVNVWQDFYGVKRSVKYASSPGNYCGLVLLFSTDNGELLAIINDGLIQHMRVAATSGVAAKYLARTDASILGIIGSGGQARSHAQAFAAIRPIQEIKVYSPNPQHRKDFAQEMRDSLGVTASSQDNPKDTVQNSDIVACCTDSPIPVFESQWLEKGTHLSSVRHWAEIDRDIISHVHMVVLHQKGVSPVYRVGKPEEWEQSPLASRQPRNPIPDDAPILPDLVMGRHPGRTSPEQISYFCNNEGAGVQFAAAGAVVYRKALECGLGQELSSKMFLQDIRD